MGVRPAPELAGRVGPATPVAEALWGPFGALRPETVGRSAVRTSSGSTYTRKLDDYVMLGVVVRFLEVGR